MIAKVCDRESRRDSWFENRLVKLTVELCAKFPSRNEYYPADVNSAPTQDIRKREKDKDKTDNPSDQSEEEMDDDVMKWEEPDKSDKKRRIGVVNK